MQDSILDKISVDCTSFFPATDKTIQMSIMTESVTIAQQKKAQVEGEASAAETKNNR